MLTTDQLRAISKEATPVVKRLLWDIHKLRRVVRCANQVSEHLGSPDHHGAPLDILLAGLKDELKDLEFLREDKTRNEELLNGDKSRGHARY